GRLSETESRDPHPGLPGRVVARAGYHPRRSATTLAVSGRGEHGEDPSSTEERGHRNPQAEPGKTELAGQPEVAARTRPPWGRRLCRGEEGQSPASQLTSGRPLPGVQQGEGLCSGGAGSAGAAGRAGAHHRHDLRTGEAALQSLFAGVTAQAPT